MLAMLLAARHEDGSPMSDQELRDELMTLLVAGHETTASSLAWAFTVLPRNPEVLATLADEVRSGDGDDYVTATIHETLRARPVLPNAQPRYTVKPITVGGFDYPEGICLVPNAYLVHHDADIYPDPYAFRPERFLDEGPGTYTWIPFGGGRRRCLGASFAMAEMKLVLNTVLADRDVVADGTVELPRRRNITIRPAGGARAALARPHPGARGRVSAWAPSCARGARNGHHLRMAVCRPRADLVDDVHRRLARAGWLSHLAGGVVVFLAVGFLIPIFADPGERDELALLNGPPVAVYFVLAGVAIARYMRRHIRRSLAWLTEGREPTDAEHRASLRLAVREIKVAALAWAIGVAGFAVYNGVVYSWDFALMSAATVWAGAETTCALNYLIAERILRPVTALALQARPATGMVAPGVRGRLTGAWLLGTGVPLLGVVTVGVAGILRPTSTPSTWRPPSCSWDSWPWPRAWWPRCSWPRRSRGR